MSSEPQRTSDLAMAMIQGTKATGNEWPDPKPLPQELPEVAQFDYDLLPVTQRSWVRDISERVQCPPDFPAITVLIAMATLVGRKIGIRPKRHDDWLVVANLWGAAVGPPSVMKTPAIQEILKALKRLEIAAKTRFQAEMAQYLAALLVGKQKLKVAEKSIKDALKKGEDALAIAEGIVNDDPPPPVRRRYLVNDATVEKLGELLNENPNGVLCYRDELIGLLKSLDKEGQEGARSFYLEAWNGNGRYTYDRIGRGTIDIESAILSIIGSIQPGPLRHYVHGAVSGGDGADGLLQRFQLVVYPDISKEWRNLDRWPDTDAKNIAYESLCYLDSFEPSSVGATIEGDEIPYLRFDDEAQKEFDQWRSELELHLRSGQEHPAVEAHLAKYRSLIPSIALLCHLVDRKTGPIRVEELRRAIAWGKYLESHARRIYAAAVAPHMVEAGALAQKLLSGALQDGFALRDIYRNGWIGLNTREAATRATEVLVDLDWLREVEQETAGRTAYCFLINPKIHEMSNQGTDKTDKSPVGVEF